MSLKDKINTTKTMKPKIETELNKINSVITEGGGTVANTISDVPSKIQNIITQYFKGAKINPNKQLNIERYKSDQTFKINVNFNFTPKYVLVSLKIDSTGNVFNLHNNININKDTSVKYEDSSSFGWYWIKQVNNTSITLGAAAGNLDYTVTVIEILALE